ncbi:sporulation protein YpjB [Terrilactibacillus sp. S3-3]|nr:sporulation protein YpjB [Terrilactibacillus sp. S3-3]
MKGILAALICMVWLSVPLHAFAKADDKAAHTWKQLSDLSDQIFEYADTKHDDAANTILDTFNKKWEQAAGKYHVPEVNERVIDTISQELKHFLQSHVNDSEARKAAIQLRLSVDAIESGDSPLWKGLQSQTMTPITAMKQAAGKNDWTDDFQQQLNQFLGSYETIYPALVIDANPDALQKVNQDVTTFSNERMLVRQDKSASLKRLNDIETELTAIFSEQTADPVEDGLILPITVIGGAILIALAYVSWKKNIKDNGKGERQQLTGLMTLTK